jgi:FkbM family methyltransferase
MKGKSIRLEEKSIQLEREAMDAVPLHRRLTELQLSEMASDSILNRASLCRLNPNDEFEVLDVGANQGDWALAMAALFPKARILAIEADPKTFETLRQRTANQTQIHVTNLAISSSDGEVTFHSHENPLLSSLLDLPDANGHTTTVRLPAMKLDDFAAQYSRGSVRLIKIDTEGNDLKVLRGAEELLNKPSLDYVIVEYGIHPADRRHVHINELTRFMRCKNFHLALLGGFGIYGEHLYGNALYMRRNPEGEAVDSSR